MRKIINLTESQVQKLLDTIISEQALPNIMKGQRGPSVARFQKRLQSLGYNVGKFGADGIFGKDTENAVKQFQNDNNIDPPSGMVDNVTAGILTTKAKVSPSRKPTSVLPKQKSPASLTTLKDPTAVFDKKGQSSSTGVKPIVKGQPAVTNKPPITQPATQPTAQAKVTPEPVKGGGIKGFLRKLAPNVAQMFFTKPLTGADFTRRQKSVIYNVIQNAIKRGQKRQSGVTSYDDYSPEIKATFDNATGASTKDILTKTFTDPYFQIASTLGRFTYRLQPDGTYMVNDIYDFSKGQGYTVTKDELQGMSYLEQLAYVKRKDNLSLYRAAREIEYIEHPDTEDPSSKVKINVQINPQEFA